MTMVLASDVVIFGGGCAGLWLLDTLRKRGFRVLLVESNAIGSRQTGLAQGILHSGLKYLFHAAQSAFIQNFQGATDIWRDALLGKIEPDLQNVQMRGQHCYLWRVDTIRSILSMALAVNGLKLKLQPVTQNERPRALLRCPGSVWRIEEQVIDPTSLLKVLVSRNSGRVWGISSTHSPAFRRNSDGQLQSVRIVDHQHEREMEISASHFIFAAGDGNASLRRLAGLSGDVMQLRPLHVAMVVGHLPELNGHCIDGTSTRITVTSEQCADGRVAWQLGGRLSEIGVNDSSDALVERAERELKLALPSVDTANCQWITRRIDRAEAKTAKGAMPPGPQVLHDENVLTVWPTKLVLTPVLVAMVEQFLGLAPLRCNEFSHEIQSINWPEPPVAPPLWKEAVDQRPAN